LNTKPQSHVYMAASVGAPASRRRRFDGFWVAVGSGTVVGASPRPAIRAGRSSRWRRSRAAPVLLRASTVIISKRRLRRMVSPAGQFSLGVNTTLINKLVRSGKPRPASLVLSGRDRARHGWSSLGRGPVPACRLGFGAARVGAARVGVSLRVARSLAPAWHRGLVWDNGQRSWIRAASAPSASPSP